MGKIICDLGPTLSEQHITRIEMITQFNDGLQQSQI